MDSSEQSWLSKQEIVFLIDGSTHCAGFGSGTPIQIASTMALRAAKKFGCNDVSVSCFFFDHKNLAEVSPLAEHTIRDFRNGLGSGSSIDAALQNMRLKPTNQPRHVILFTDITRFFVETAREQLLGLLKSQPRTTVAFIAVASEQNPSLEQLVEGLAGNAVSQQAILLPEEAEEPVMRLIQSRMDAAAHFDLHDPEKKAARHAAIQKEFDAGLKEVITVKPPVRPSKRLKSAP